MILKNTYHYIHYKDGHWLNIKYPEACDKTKHDVGDYCWGLAIAYENNDVEKFVKICCPCEDI